MPAFAHYLPEMNHNEMVGRTAHTMSPHFLIMLSQYTHPRNIKRVAITKELLMKAGYPVTIVALQGDNIEAEIMMMYHLMDYVTYYLAEAQGIDPEPVAMVEEFKQML